MDKFWRWVVNEAAEKPVRTIYLEGYIAESSWFDDDVTPKQFKADLYEGGGMDDIVVKIHSPGGDSFAAAQIYNLLKEYPGRVSVQIDGLAASAASVIAMAGDEVLVSPVSVLMIHNPAMLVAGEASDLEVGINLLNEVKESIMNAYERKTGLSRQEISRMMDGETWMSAQKAIELNFADGFLYEAAVKSGVQNGFLFDTVTVTNAMMSKLSAVQQKMRQLAEAGSKDDPLRSLENNVPITQLEKRLDLIKNWR